MGAGNRVRGKNFYTPAFLWSKRVSIFRSINPTFEQSGDNAVDVEFIRLPAAAFPAAAAELAVHLSPPPTQKQSYHLRARRRPD